MAQIDVRRRHNLGKEKARETAESLARELEDRLDARYRWDGDVLVFERKGAKGRLAVTEDEVHLTIELGLVLRPMKGTIERHVTAYLDERLG